MLNRLGDANKCPAGRISLTLSGAGREAARGPCFTGWSGPPASAKVAADFRRAKEAKRVKPIAWSTLTVVALTAVAHAQPPSSPTAAPAVGATVAPPARVSAPEADAYIIGPGDTLQVFVWRNPDLSATIPVRPDGKISTPLVEDLVAVGKTPSQLARAIEKVLADYVRSPQVNIIVTQPVSTLSQVKVIGQVAKPQAVAYHEGLTVLDVVLSVGGMSQFAAGNRAKIMRMQDGKQREIHVKLASLINGDMKQNVLMKPGDVLVVPESFF